MTRWKTSMLKNWVGFTWKVRWDAVEAKRVLQKTTVWKIFRGKKPLKQSPWLEIWQTVAFGRRFAGATDCPIHLRGRSGESTVGDGNPRAKTGTRNSSREMKKSARDRHKFWTMIMNVEDHESWRRMARPPVDQAYWSMDETTEEMWGSYPTAQSTRLGWYYCEGTNAG